MAGPLGRMCRVCLEHVNCLICFSFARNFSKICRKEGVSNARFPAGV